MKPAVLRRKQNQNVLVCSSEIDVLILEGEKITDYPELMAIPQARVHTYVEHSSSQMEQQKMVARNCMWRAGEQIPVYKST